MFLQVGLAERIKFGLYLTKFDSFSQPINRARGDVVKKLTEEKFLLILNADARSRLLTFSDLRKFLCALFVYSLVMIGVAYKVVNGGNIGWENLSPFWQRVFRLEILLFIVHVLSILLSIPSRPFSWRFSSIAAVIFMYKAAFDAFVAFMMLAKDKHIDDVYVWTALYSISACVLFHLFFLYFWIRKRIHLQEIGNLEVKTYNKEISASIIGFFVVLSSIQLNKVPIGYGRHKRNLASFIATVNGLEKPVHI